jgi:uncharacterized Zn finger protein (UPF0148 family)
MHMSHTVCCTVCCTVMQEFAEAEEEEAAALELQKASYSRLTAADFDDDAVSSSSDSDSDADATTAAATAAAAGTAADDSLGARLQQQQQQQEQSNTSTSSRKKGGKKSPTVNGESHSSSADASGLRGELEALLSGRAADVSVGPTTSGAAAAVEVATVRRDLSKLSRKDKLALVIGDSPELPGLCASLHAVLEELCEKIDPLAQEVTAELGASDDGLMYLQVCVLLYMSFDILVHLVFVLVVVVLVM